ncbi:M24 family metallopeptidase [bacterium]|nr:M24 family metallopeptidase [bacterium]
MKSSKSARLKSECQKVLKILEAYHGRINPRFMTPRSEFRRRQQLVQQALAAKGYDVGVVFSDEHYAGDVPYLGGNINVCIEQVAGAIGATGFHIIAGLEGGYVAEQLSPRAGATVHKVEMLQLADEKYPIDAERLEDVLSAAAGKPLGQIKQIALLTPRQILPASVFDYLERLVGKDNVVDAQELYYRIKYEKSAVEMRLIRDACTVADAMMRGMLAVLRPGMLETEVAAWAYFIGRELGCEDNGFKVIVGANTANRTLIGKALNRPIRAGDWVHLGVAPTRDGLNSCIRRSVIAGRKPSQLTRDQRYWFDFIEEAYQVGYDQYVRVAKEGLPAKLQEQALVDFFDGKADEVSRRVGRKIDLARLKPYTGTHNAGYTECQEFFGAITLESDEPLGYRIVTMLDVALRGIGNHWNDVVIPGLDYILIENTLGKFGKRVETLTKLPNNVQGLLGSA